MPKEFVRTSEPFYLYFHPDGTSSEFYTDARVIDGDAGYPDDLDKTHLYVWGFEIRWDNDQSGCSVQLATGAFEMSTHEPFSRVVEVHDGTEISQHPLTTYIQLENRWQVQELIRLARRARNGTFGSDE